MSQFTIGLLQMDPEGGDAQKNLEKGTSWCRKAKASGADLALFPEIWSTGYTCGFEVEHEDIQAHWRSLAIGRDDAWVRHFRALAAELDMAIGLTYLERWEGAPRNTISVIDRHGEIVLTYAKVHTCDFFPMESSCTPGEGFHVATLDTAAGPVELGAMICYDREHPESARILMLKGAEVVVVPNACSLQALRLGQFRGRAWENAMVVAMTNYASGHTYCNGRSVAYDAEGELLVQAGGGEGIYLAPVDLDALRAYRGKTVFGNAFRRPHKYELLESMEVGPPFAGRKNGFGEAWERGER
ncbi:MAG: carbon-nitrogen hydrolase family protein [Spirochaetota bacterium]